MFTNNQYKLFGVVVADKDTILDMLNTKYTQLEYMSIQMHAITGFNNDQLCLKYKRDFGVFYKQFLREINLLKQGIDGEALAIVQMSIIECGEIYKKSINWWPKQFTLKNEIFDCGYLKVEI